MSAQIKSVLETMRSTYEAKSFEELCAVSWIEEEPIQLGSRTYRPAVWAELLHDGHVLLVVQLSRSFLGFGTTESIGLKCSPSGELVPVDAEWLMNEVGHP